MKKLVIVISTICLSFCLVACSISIIPEAKSRPSTAKMLIQKLKIAKLPIGKIIVYTDATDENHLLGRPNQYISKVNFADKRCPQLDPDDPIGGSIETFSNSEDLKARVDYINALSKSIPILTEYHIVNGNYLLRLSKNLTPKQVNQYKKVFMALK